MKVYCKDCKYFREAGGWTDVDSGHSASWDEGCIHDQKTSFYKKIKDVVTGIIKKVYVEGIELNYKEENKNNNCNYYKRKWYKFGKPKNIGIADGSLSIVEKDDAGGLSLL